MIEMAKIVHGNYEKITDDIMWLSSNWLLRFTVCLNRYSDKYGRQNYHKEYGYVKDVNNCININRSFDYYLHIDSAKRDQFGNKESIMIRNTDIYTFKFKLKLVCEWFTGDSNQGLFARKDGKIIMPRKVEPIKMVGLAADKYLEFEPTVYNADNGDQVVGVRMYLSNDNNSLFMDINRLFSFRYIIDTFNMYQSAQLMLNYLQRPAYGTNFVDLSNKGKVDNNGKFLK